jgi:serine/threonine protein phosphatase PrpC
VSAGEGARIQSAAQSDVGRSRTENQDAFGEFTSAAGERLFVVATAWAGTAAGPPRAGSASRRWAGSSARAAVGTERLHRASSCERARSPSGRGGSRAWRNGHHAVVLVLSPDGTATLGWVGDSRAYVSGRRAGAPPRITRSSARWSVGVLSQAEAESHPRRNELLRRSAAPRGRGRDANLRPARDRFLLCTDGLAWRPEAEVGVVLGTRRPTSPCAS